MTDQLQKNLDNATRDRFEAQAAIAQQNLTPGQKPGMGEKTFVKEADKAEAKAMNRDPITGSAGSHPIEPGIGTTGGAAAGAVIGAFAGPLGLANGGVVGAIVGAAAGHTAGEKIHPTAEEDFWREAFVNEPYFNVTHSFDDYAPAYRSGYIYRTAYADRPWTQAEAELEANWEANRGTSRLRWNEARDAIHAAWDRAGTARN